MRRLLFCLFFIASFNSIVLAQQNHFIYIQTESRQPFYVKLDKKLYSSSATGYVIIPKLLDGSYAMQIGFPNGNLGEQNLNCIVDKKDNGYLLKDFGEKGWGLFDLQTLTITRAEPKAKKEIVKKEEKDDAFSNMLSNVVNDPSIRQKEVTEETPKEPEPVKKEEAAVVPVIKKNEDQVKSEETVKAEQPVISRSVVKRTMISNGKDGTEMIYIDSHDGQKDTIRVFIPADKNVITETKEEAKPEESKKEEPKKEEPVPVPVKAEVKTLNKEEEAVKKEARFIDMDMSTQATEPVTVKKEEKKKSKSDKSTVKVTEVPDTTDTVAVKAPVVEKKGKKKKITLTPEEEEKLKKEPILPSYEKTGSPQNANCKGIADDDNFLKLRKKMAAADNDDDMINTARKAFKSKCYTTDQVKNLSVLFLADEGKYKFFDAAYSFISDQKNFATLQGQLTEEYYINRFKAMIK